MRHPKYPWLESSDANHTEQFDKPDTMKISISDIIGIVLILLTVAFVFGAMAGYAARNDRIATCAYNDDCVEVVK